MIFGDQWSENFDNLSLILILDIFFIQDSLLTSLSFFFLLFSEYRGDDDMPVKKATTIIIIESDISNHEIIIEFYDK